MKDVFHQGELFVQHLAGEGAAAAQNSQMISSHFSNGIVKFLQTQQFAVLSSTDGQGNVWVTFLTGQPGFAEVLGEQRLAIKAELLEADPLAEESGKEKQIGLLIIDTNRRIRLRINGTAKMNKALMVTAQQIYGNCPRFIQKRTLSPVNETSRLLKSAQRNQALSQSQRDWIAYADTFYIGSMNDKGEMDASHRGGNPGFIHVLDEKTILFPDYSGNSLFNTLGNIYSNPASGLLFINYEHGHSLHLTGSAEIIWDEEQSSAFPGAERLVRFEISEVVELVNATELRWEEIEMSPFNP